MNVKPTAQLTHAGIWGIGAMLAMGIADQLAPGVLDFTKEMMGVPLGALVVEFAVLGGGWLKGGGP